MVTHGRWCDRVAHELEHLGTSAVTAETNATFIFTVQDGPEDTGTKQLCTELVVGPAVLRLNTTPVLPDDAPWTCTVHAAATMLYTALRDTAGCFDGVRKLIEPDAPPERQQP